MPRQQPVCNEEGDVVGLLDITKVFHESLEKLERAYGSSQKLYTALEGVQSEWGSNASSQFAGAGGLISYVEALREKMSFPDLGSILDARTRAVTVSLKTSVKEAARLMREHRTTAVCVVEESGKLAGIFTSKDVVLRVIAAGLDARTCSVVRVMTPHPDTGTPSLTIQQALRKMNGGRLPIAYPRALICGTELTISNLFAQTAASSTCRCWRTTELSLAASMSSSLPMPRWSRCVSCVMS